MDSRRRLDDAPHRPILAWQEEIARRFPGVPRYRNELAAGYLIRGIVSWGRDDLAGADPYFDRARAILEPSSRYRRMAKSAAGVQVR